MFKPLNLEDKTSYVSPFDPAVDRDRIIERELSESSDAELNAQAALHFRLPFSQLTESQKRDAAWEAFTMRFAASCGKSPSAAKEMLIYTDGTSPTVFVIGAIPPDELNRIYDECRETYTHRGRQDEAAWRAFLHGLRDIEGWSGQIPKKTVRAVEYVDPIWLAEHFARGLRVIARQVGSVILQWNDLTEDEVKN